MNSKTSFITTLENLLNNDQTGEAIKITLTFLKNRQEDYLRQTYDWFDARWATIADFIDQGNATPEDQQAWQEEIKADLRGLMHEMKEKATLPANVQDNLPAYSSVKQFVFDECLRPDFTEKIARKLLVDRASVNLYGDKGTGKHRLFDDLQTVIRQAGVTNIKFIDINFKLYANDYKGLLAELHRQLGKPGKIHESIGQIFSSVEKDPCWYLIFLRNYEAILNTPDIDALYTSQFFNDLNFLKNKPNISLLLSTPKPHRNYSIFFQRKRYGTSWLDVQLEQVPSFNKAQINTLLQKDLVPEEHQWLMNNMHVYRQIVRKIYDTSAYYKMLEFLIARMNDSFDKNESFEPLLTRWIKRFDVENRTSGYKTANNVKQSLEKVAIVMGLDKLKSPWPSLLSSLFGNKKSKK